MREVCEGAGVATVVQVQGDVPVHPEEGEAERTPADGGGHGGPAGLRLQRARDRLIDVFEFERFLEKAYLGQKIFSIEGLDAVVARLTIEDEPS